MLSYFSSSLYKRSYSCFFSSLFSRMHFSKMISQTLHLPACYRPGRFIPSVAVIHHHVRRSILHPANKCACALIHPRTKHALLMQFPLHFERLFNIRQLLFAKSLAAVYLRQLRAASSLHAPQFIEKSAVYARKATALHAVAFFHILYNPFIHKAHRTFPASS